MIQAKNPILINVNYLRKNKAADQPECFEVLYLDDNGAPQVSYEPPETDIFIVKPDYRTYTYNKPEERTEVMDRVRVNIGDIRYRLAMEAGEAGKKLLQQSYQTRNPRLLNQIYRWPYSYAADFQPEFYFMRDWYRDHVMKMPDLSLAFLDIETEVLDYIPDMDNLADTAKARVNCATVILDKTKEAYTFILEPYLPPQGVLSDEAYAERVKLYEKQKKDHEYLLGHQDEFIQDLHESFDKTYGKLDYRIRFYPANAEINLIGDIFRLINTRKPQFCMCWNMRFDIQYLYYRIIELNYDPASIMCHRDFKYPRCYFKLDKFHMEFSKQLDQLMCSSYTIYICQMRMYATIRKSQHKLKSLKLNKIADTILRDKKVEYPENSNIRTFPFLDWIRFLKYNVKDVLLQYGIESKIHDIRTYYMRSHSNWTPYHSMFKETYLLRNVREKYFEQQGWVQSNNLNILSENKDELDLIMFGDPDEDDNGSFKGAIMADPRMNAKLGLPILEAPSNKIWKNTMDYDMSAFYPSIKIASNMDPITLLYKAAFDNMDFISGQYLNRSLNQTYREKDKNNKIRELDITGEAINTFVGGNILTFGYNYFGLPDVTSCYNAVMKHLDLLDTMAA